jgi:hypothetical protein
MDVTINGYRILNNYSKNSPFRNELEEKMIKYNIQDKEFGRYPKIMEKISKNFGKYNHV